MRVKASDPSHPIIHTQCKALSLTVLSLLAFPAHATKAPIYFPHSLLVSSLNMLVFSRDVCLPVLIFKGNVYM